MRFLSSQPFSDSKRNRLTLNKKLLPLEINAQVLVEPLVVRPEVLF